MNNMNKTEEKEENFSARMLAYYDAILKKISRNDTEEEMRNKQQ